MGFDMDIRGATALIDTFGDLSSLVDESPDWVVGTNVAYAAYVEFGTSTQEAQPYLRPAARRVGRNVDAYFDQADDPEAALKKMALDIEREAKHLAPVDTGNLQNSIEAEQV